MPDFASIAADGDDPLDEGGGRVHVGTTTEVSCFPYQRRGVGVFRPAVPA